MIMIRNWQFQAWGSFASKWLASFVYKISQMVTSLTLYLQKKWNKRKQLMTEKNDYLYSVFPTGINMAQNASVSESVQCGSELPGHFH